MKASALGVAAAVLISTLAASALSTIPAQARGAGAFPSQIGPSYPFPSYCVACWGAWQVPPARPPRLIVRHPKLHHPRENARAAAAQ
jgi:hypothetical protein